jgi:hypothetical protein
MHEPSRRCTAPAQDAASLFEVTTPIPTPLLPTQSACTHTAVDVHALPKMHGSTPAAQAQLPEDVDEDHEAAQHDREQPHHPAQLVEQHA